MTAAPLRGDVALAGRRAGTAGTTVVPSEPDLVIRKTMTLDPADNGGGETDRDLW
jgi:hypothetical protein